MIDERTEILINRRLDGVLSDEESLELDKLLIRDPQARAMLEDYARCDALAGSALKQVLPEAPQSSVRSAALQQRHGRGSWILGRRLGAIAAALLMAVMIAGGPNRRAQVGGGGSSMPAPSIAGEPVSTGSEILNQAHQEQHEVNRDVIAVYDKETNSYYLLEMKHVQSTARPLTVDY